MPMLQPEYGQAPSAVFIHILTWQSLIMAPVHPSAWIAEYPPIPRAKMPATAIRFATPVEAVSLIIVLSFFVFECCTAKHHKANVYDGTNANKCPTQTFVTHLGHVSFVDIA